MDEKSSSLYTTANIISKQTFKLTYNDDNIIVNTPSFADPCMVDGLILYQPY